MNKELSNVTKMRLLIALVLTVIILSSIFIFFEGRLYYQRREKNLYLAANQSRLMEGSLNAVMARVYTLRALVETNHGSTDFFKDSAEEIYNETVEDTGLYVKNFVLAPNGIVEDVYPLKGNENLVGLNYLDKDLNGNVEAMEAYSKDTLILTTPFELRQGGTGIAGRLPVFLKNHGKKVFWGMVSVTLDMEYLLKQFNLDYLEETGTDYCLWYMNGNGEKVILSQTEKIPNHPISYELNPRNLKWILEVEPQNGWVTPFEIISGILVIFVLSYMIYHILETRAKIKNINGVLEEIAIKDNLTGCYSRHYVNVMLLESGTKRWRDPNDCYSLALVDVDFFKQINDTYGHDAGDLALVAVADVLKGLCDELRGDCVIRYGGDEFIFLMNHADHQLFECRLEQIVVRVREISLNEVPQMSLSVSVGGVEGTKADTYYELFSRADKQVYKSKELGKNRYSIEEP